MMTIKELLDSMVDLTKKNDLEEIVHSIKKGTFKAFDHEDRRWVIVTDIKPEGKMFNMEDIDGLRWSDTLENLMDKTMYRSIA